MSSAPNMPSDESGRPPSEKNLDDALAATFPASDPIAFHEEPSSLPASQPPRWTGDQISRDPQPSDDQSLNAGSQRTEESEGSGGSGRGEPRHT